LHITKVDTAADFARAKGLMHVTITGLLHCVAAARELIIWAGRIYI